MLTSAATGGQDGADLGCGRRAAAHRAPSLSLHRLTAIPPGSHSRQADSRSQDDNCRKAVKDRNLNVSANRLVHRRA
jgi:hypothetical protein